MYAYPSTVLTAYAQPAVPYATIVYGDTPIVSTFPPITPSPQKNATQKRVYLTLAQGITAAI